MLKWSHHIIEQMESIHKVGEEHVHMPVPADGSDGVETKDELYGYTASTMKVKMQSGQTKEELTLPYLLHHLPKYTLACVGVQYKHYQAMPFAFVDVLVHDMLNSQVTMVLLISGELAYFTQATSRRKMHRVAQWLGR